MLKHSQSHTSSEFEDLQAFWYARLKAEGFADIEVNDRYAPGCPNLIVVTRPFSERTCRSRAVAEETEYCRLARGWLWSQKFAAPREREVWRLRYDEGHTERQIAATLQCSKTTISRTLQRLRARFLKAIAQDQAASYRE